LGPSLREEIHPLGADSLSKRELLGVEIWKQLPKRTRIYDCTGQTMFAQAPGLLQHGNAYIRNAASGFLVPFHQAGKLDGARKSRWACSDDQHIHLDRLCPGRVFEDHAIEWQARLIATGKYLRHRVRSWTFGGRLTRRVEYNDCEIAAMDLQKAGRDPWVWGQTAIMFTVVLGAPLIPRHINLGSADFMLNRIDPNWIRGVGGLLTLLGLALTIWGARSLGRSLTPGIEPLNNAELVTSGAYEHVRHPIYTGLVLLLAGYTLAWSNWTLALIVGSVSLLFLNGKAAAEEKWLLTRYPGYRAYMRYVPRRIL
jgi:protein-S-isoprenylcysteine O-methyltransferase Ste14